MEQKHIIVFKNTDDIFSFDQIRLLGFSAYNSLEIGGKMNYYANDGKFHFDISSFSLGRPYTTSDSINLDLCPEGNVKEKFYKRYDAAVLVCNKYYSPVAVSTIFENMVSLERPVVVIFKKDYDYTVFTNICRVKTNTLSRLGIDQFISGTRGMLFGSEKVKWGDKIWFNQDFINGVTSDATNMPQASVKTDRPEGVNNVNLPQAATNITPQANEVNIVNKDEFLRVMTYCTDATPTLTSASSRNTLLASKTIETPVIAPVVSETPTKQKKILVFKNLFMGFDYERVESLGFEISLTKIKDDGTHYYSKDGEFDISFSGIDLGDNTVTSINYKDLYDNYDGVILFYREPCNNSMISRFQGRLISDDFPFVSIFKMAKLSGETESEYHIATSDCRMRANDKDMKNLGIVDVFRGYTRILIGSKPVDPNGEIIITQNLDEQPKTVNKLESIQCKIDKMKEIIADYEKFISVVWDLKI